MRPEVVSLVLAIPVVELANLGERPFRWHPSLVVIGILVTLVTVIVFLACRRKRARKPQLTVLP